MVVLSNLRNEVTEHLKIMGYNPVSIRLTTTKGGVDSVSVEGYFHEYLGGNLKFSAIYVESKKGFVEFIVKEDPEK